MRHLKDLEGKTITQALWDERDMSVTIICADGTTLVAAARSGGGADGNWYNWTEITLGDEKLIDE